MVYRKFDKSVCFNKNEDEEKGAFGAYQIKSNWYHMRDKF